PRGDHSHDADRLARDFDVEAGPHGRDLFAGETEAFAGKVQEYLRGADDFAHAFRNGLSLFLGQEASELVFARHDLVADALEDVVAGLRIGARPRRESRLGGGDGRIHLLAVAVHEPADNVLRIGGVDVLGDARALEPGAADEILFYCRR